jgi:hypothetical protein
MLQYSGGSIPTVEASDLQVDVDLVNLTPAAFAHPDAADDQVETAQQKLLVIDRD